MEYDYNLDGRVWLEKAGVKVLGKGRVELLERIQQSGSIRQAALQMKMSYKQAWELIKHMNTHFGTPLVETHRGGKGGGNAVVTPFALNLINEYKLLQTKFREFLSSNNIELNK